MGVSRRLKERFPELKVIAVDIVGSVLFGGTSGPREIPVLEQVLSQLSSPPMKLMMSFM